MMAADPVRAVLVNFHSLDALRRLLRSGALTGCAVTIVDNGDDPTGVSALCTTFNARAILLPENVGFAAAVNRAVSSRADGSGPWLLLNPDVTVSADQLAELRASLEGDGVDAVAPLLVLPSGRLQIGAAGGPVTLWSTASYFLFISHIFTRVRGIFLTRKQSHHVDRVAWLCMACMMLKADAFDRFGAIPEDELVYAEDIAWGSSATAKGARLRLVGSIRVGHESGGSGGNAAWVGALERLCLRRLGHIRGTLALAAIRVGLLVRNAVNALRTTRRDRQR